MKLIRKLFWDDWNIDHIIRHAVRPEEIEQLCLSEKILLSKASGTKIRVIGKTAGGRYLTVFLGPREKQSFYVVTARDSTLKEKRLFQRRLI